MTGLRIITEITDGRLLGRGEILMPHCLKQVLLVSIFFTLSPS